MPDARPIGEHRSPAPWAALQGPYGEEKHPFSIAHLTPAKTLRGVASKDTPLFRHGIMGPSRLVGEQENRSR